MNLTGLLVLLLAALLAAAQPKRADAFPTRRRVGGAALLALVYAAGAMAAMYITYTPVGMVRIVGLQARYFLCVWLALLPALAAVSYTHLNTTNSCTSTGVPRMTQT